MKCKNCGRTFSGGDFCPDCQMPVKKNSPLVPILVVIIVLLVMLLGIVKNTHKDKPIAENVPEGNNEQIEEAVENEDGYLVPDSDERYMTEDELYGKAREEIALIRNEIFARRGYIFTKSPYKEYFAMADWYVPNPEFTQEDFNKYEKANVKFIVQYEEEQGWRDDGDTVTAKEDGYLRPGSDREYLTREELVFYTKTELAYIRNEIYARHGYIFKKSPYKEYFAHKSWYKPNKNFSENLLNKYEKANVSLIKDFEEGNIARLDYSDTWNYILPYSNYEYISKADLLGRSQDEVAFIRNEIYARRGYVFNKEPYKSYFNSKSWYFPDKSFSTSEFNNYEKENLRVIEEYEKSMGWR